MRSRFAALLAVALGTGCVPFGSKGPEPASRDPIDLESVGPPPPSPAAFPPGPAGDSAVWWRALAADERRIVVSKEARRLWLIQVDSTLFSAPVAVAPDTSIRFGDHQLDFSTPTGLLEVLDKSESPEWVPPACEFHELAVTRGLEPVWLSPDTTVYVSDYTWILVRDGQVGRVDRFGYWKPITPGGVIALDGRLFIPPLPSPQRRLPWVFGTHRLILGGGHLIHGTPSIGTAGPWTGHGGVRMRSHDIAVLYAMVDPGTPVYIY